MLNLSHRSKLTLTITVTVSLAIALVLAGVLLVVRNQALERRRLDLFHCVDRVAHEYTGPESLADEQVDFPDIAIYVFTASGRLIDTNGGHTPRPQSGFRKVKEELQLGLEYHQLLFLGVASWKETEAGLQQIGLVLGLLWLPLTALTALSAWIAGGLALRPVKELIKSAERLSSSGDELDLSTSDTAEYAELVTSLNRLLTRVRYAAHLQEQFAADAAHELRSPLAILRTRIEANLMRDREPAEHVQSQQKMLVQVDRLTSIVEALLRSARHEHGSAEALDLFEACRSFCVEWSEEMELEPGQLALTGTKAFAAIAQDELSVILANLLENAKRYTPPGTKIELQIRQDSDWSTLTVRDLGPGIPVEHRQRVFERFYRPEDSRNSESGGAGIGLAIVRRIAEMRGGRVQLDEVATGTSITMLLPVVKSA